MLPTPHERHLVLTYLSNLASSVSSHAHCRQRLIEWTNEYADQFTLPRMDASRWADHAGRRDGRRGRATNGPSRSEWNHFVKSLRRARAATRDIPDDQTTRGLQHLGRLTGLSDEDARMVEFLLRYKTQSLIEWVVDSVCNDIFPHHMRRFSIKDSCLGMWLGVSRNTILTRTMPDAPLIRSGLMRIDNDKDIALNDRLHRLSGLPDDADMTGASVLRLLLHTGAPGQNAWSDFDHLAQHRNHVERLLKGALRTDAPGVNVLLYGPPGTGKTEFCKTLAAQLGVTLYSVGEADDDRGEPNRFDRLAELRLAQCLVRHERRSLLLFDEMDDLLIDGMHGAGIARLFGGTTRRGGSSKVFMNRLLEQTPTPILWITNCADGIDPAILRRMTFALEMRLPPPKIRARIWSVQLSRHHIEATADDAMTLAAEFATTPGVATGATAAARLIDGSMETVRHGVRSLARVLSCDTPPQRPPARFDTALLRADEDPARLADRLANHHERRVSLCLQGPPGTGKSAFARYLAERMGLDVIQKRTSDLLSCWVGETEQRIAAAFAEARDAESLLIFDEADSLLADRRRAVRNWEVSQVNEMLTWMESHPFPFVCTTNCGEGLDPASLRRFVFKITFEYLTPDQAATAFRAYFEMEPPRDLAALSMLTPGDFAVVRRKAEILHVLRDAPTLADMLRVECDAKPGYVRPIGMRT